VFGRFAQGMRFADLALALTDRFQNPALEAKLLVLLGLFVTPYGRGLRAGIEMLARGGRVARAEGNVQYTTFASILGTTLVLGAGRTLSECASIATEGLKNARQAGDADLAQCASWVLALVAELVGTAPSELRLPPDAPLPPPLGQELHRAMGELVLDYHLGTTRRGEARIRRAEVVAASFPGIYTVDLAVYGALERCRIVEAGGVGFLRARRLLWEARRRAKLIGRWRAVSPESFGPHHELVLAELARVGGRDREALAGFDRAIEAAAADGALKIAAIAWERRADCERRAFGPAQAASSRERAIAAYEAWGAHAKAAQLRAAR
jgi:hypothetical protein